MATVAYNFDWQGPAAIKRVLDATATGMTQVLADCVEDAKKTESAGGTMPFRHGYLQGSIQARLPAMQGNTLVGYWGSFDISYAIYQEMGTMRIRERRFLRNAVDRFYPTLAGRIKAAME